MSPAKLAGSGAKSKPPTRDAHKVDLSQGVHAADAPPSSPPLAPLGNAKKAGQRAGKVDAVPRAVDGSPLPGSQDSVQKPIKSSRGSDDGNQTASTAPAKKDAARGAAKGKFEPAPSEADTTVPNEHTDCDREDCMSMSTTYGNHCGSVSLPDAVGTVISLCDSSSPSVVLEVEARKEEKQTNTTTVYFVFGLVFLLEIFVNFDAGVIPAILPTLEKEFNLDGTTEGLLGALPYIGLSLSSPFVGRGLTRFSPKYFCLFTMLINMLATGLLGLAVNRWMLFSSRFLLGLTQAGFSIYAPVWVDKFAPPDKLTLWMGLAQGGVVIGTMLGCVTAGSLDASRHAGFAGAHWRYALAIQFGWLLVLLVAWGFTPRSFLEIHLESSSYDETESVSSSQVFDEFECAASEVGSEEVTSPAKVKATPLSGVTVSPQQDVQGPPMREATSEAPQGVQKEIKDLSDSHPEEEGAKKERPGDAEATPTPHRERRAVRSSHRQSDLPEYLKDPLSNLLPLDFFGFNAQPRRVPRTRYSVSEFPGGHRDEGPPTVFIENGVLSSLHPPNGGEVVQPAERPSGMIDRTWSMCYTQEAHRLPGHILRQCSEEGSGQDSRGDGFNTFQYQMTFLTPHPTTLAFEALNWASGTQDPMLLVQRESRQPSTLTQNLDSLDGSPVGEAGVGGPADRPGEGGTDSRATAARVHEGSPEIHFERDNERMSKAAAVQTSGLTAVSSKRQAATKTFGVYDSIKILLSSPLYVCVTFSLCALFFEVTAIQFWSITYFQQVLKYSAGTVLLAFNVTAATAPILGVLSGGWFVDLIGGYKDERGMRRTMSVLLLCSIGCFLFGIGAGWTSNFWFIIFCIWWILFLGGCILPAATGIVIASVPVEVRAFGSGFCMMVFNILGYVLGTFLPGLLVEAFSLVWGLRVVYMWSLNGVLGFALACCFLWSLNIKPTFISNDEMH